MQHGVVPRSYHVAWKELGRAWSLVRALHLQIMDILLFCLFPVVSVGIVTLYVWSKENQPPSARAQTGDSGTGAGDKPRSVDNLKLRNVSISRPTVISSFMSNK
jgi:hypothetical protein